jgi:hypothetical protein
MVVAEHNERTSGGHRLLIQCPGEGWRYDPHDPDDFARVLAEIHGGSAEAAAWLRQVLTRLAP